MDFNKALELVEVVTRQQQQLMETDVCAHHKIQIPKDKFGLNDAQLKKLITAYDKELEKLQMCGQEYSIKEFIADKGKKYGL